MIIENYTDLDVLLRQVKTVIPEIKIKKLDKNIEIYSNKKLLISSHNEKDVKIFLSGLLSGLNIFISKMKDERI